MPTHEVLPTTITAALRPYVEGDARDLADAVDAVTENLYHEINSRIDPKKIEPKLTWRALKMTSERYGFEKRHSWDDRDRSGWTLAGHVDYPERVEGSFQLRLDLRACWLAALDRARRLFRAETDLASIQIDPNTLQKTLQSTCASWDVEEFSVNEERIEAALDAAGKITDHAQTTFYDRNGEEEEETTEGLSARFTFRFDRIDKDRPKATVTETDGWNPTIEFIVPFRVRVRIDGPK